VLYERAEVHVAMSVVGNLSTSHGTSTTSIVNEERVERVERVENVRTHCGERADSLRRACGERLNIEQYLRLDPCADYSRWTFALDSEAEFIPLPVVFGLAMLVDRRLVRPNLVQLK